jgi:hypothetical protein
MSKNEKHNERNNDEHNHEDHSLQCPICFVDHNDNDDASPDSAPLLFVHGPCGHVFCQPCLERHLLRWNAAASVSTRQDFRYAPIEMPTLGRCPVCRQELYLLDVVEYEEYEKSNDTNSNESNSRKMSVSKSMRNVSIKKNTKSLYHKNTDCSSWPIAGMVFAELSQGTGVGWGSLHFPPHPASVVGSLTPELLSKPYMDTTKFPMANRNRQMRLAFFGAHYYAPTRTFRGSVRIPFETSLNHTNTSDADATEQEQLFTVSNVLVQFSADYSYITTGVIIKRQQLLHNLTQIRNEHPFDGRWKVVEYQNPAGGSSESATAVATSTLEIDVTGRSFYDSDGNFCVAQMLSADALEENQRNGYSNGNKNDLVCRIVDAASIQAVWGLQRSEWDRTVQPMGPEVGESLCWTRIVENDNSSGNTRANSNADNNTEDTNGNGGNAGEEVGGENDDSTTATTRNRNSTMVWTRLTISETVPPNTVNRLGGSSGSLFQRVLSAQERAARLEQEQLANLSNTPVYHIREVWGNTFCQASRVGLASYHFVAPASASASASGNNNMDQDDNNNGNNDDDDDDDDGLPHVYISYEHRDTAQWPPLDNGSPIPRRVRFHNVSFPTPSTFRGEIHWQGDYGTSWQGDIRWEYEMTFDEAFMCIVSGQVKSVTQHNEDPQEWVRYGQDLIYINAAMWDHFRQERDNSSGMDAAMTDIDQFREMSAQLQRRLRRDGASVRAAASIHRILVAAHGSNGTNPVDYNLL